MIREATHEALLNILAPRAGERVLDLGCGAGRLARDLTRLGCLVTGLDRDPAVLEQARLEAPDATFVCADVRAYRPDQPFDAVVMVGVLHWLTPLGPSVAMLRQLLRPGGRLAGVCGGDGASPVEECELRSQLRQAGFSEVEIEAYQDRLWFFAVRPGETDVA